MMLMVFALSMLVSWALAAWICRGGFERWYDAPGARSLHAVPVPRIGGVAIWAGVIVGLLAAKQVGVVSLITPSLLLAAILLAAVALADDRFTTPVWLRLGCQCAAAILAVVVAGLYVQMPMWPPLLWMTLGVLVFLWGINLYNFMDGMDGFAGGMAVFGFGGLAALGWLAGDVAFATVNAILVCTHVGFLFLNFPPARLFMGDIGSTLAGFAMVACGIAGWQRGLYPVWVPLVLFSPFWLDATVTLLGRLFRGEAVWQAHRQHHYQRWVLAGFSHRRVVLVEYGLMVFCLMLVMSWNLGNNRYNEGVVLGLWATVSAGVLFWSRRELTWRSAQGNPT